MHVAFARVVDEAEPERDVAGVVRPSSNMRFVVVQNTSRAATAAAMKPRSITSARARSRDSDGDCSSTAVATAAYFGPGAPSSSWIRLPGD